MPASWVNTDSLLMDLEGRNGDAAILISGGVHGVALVAGGALVGVYTETERQPVASLERLAALLRAPGARVTLRQNPEEMPVDQMPETAYHAFVEAAGETPTLLREPVTARPAPERNGIVPSITLPVAESAPPPVDAPAPFGEPETQPEAWAAPSDPVPEAWSAPSEAVPETWAPPSGPAPEAWAGPSDLAPDTWTAPPSEAAPTIPSWSTAPLEPDGPSLPADPDAPLHSEAPDGLEPPTGPSPSTVPFLAVVPNEPPPAEPGGPAGDPSVATDWSPSPLDDLQEVGAPLTPWSGVYQVPAAGEGAPGPAQFADFATSQGLDDLGGPAPGPDFDTVKADLIQIGALWLGTDGVGPIAEMLQRARPTIADVMATIDSIKNVALPGFEPSVVQAMAREMYYHAAEYLSGL
jgi:hypothetical protein